jgi:hypothetical protein
MGLAMRVMKEDNPMVRRSDKLLTLGVFAFGVFVSTAEGQGQTKHPMTPLSADVTITTTSMAVRNPSTQVQTGKYWRGQNGKTRQDTGSTSVISDPESRTIINLDHSKKEALVIQLPPAEAAQPVPAAAPASPPLSPARKVSFEDLGESTMGGFRVKGQRITAPNPTGLKLGTLVTETWMAPDLFLPIYSKQTLPEQQTIQEYKNIQLGEPDPAVFAIPDGYAVKTAQSVSPPAR